MSIVPGTLDRETEFWASPLDGHILDATCGDCALARCESWARQSYVSTVSVYLRMRAGGLLDNPENGASNAWQWWQQAQRDGFRADYLPFADGLPFAAWAAFYAAREGRAAFALEVANGQALRDELTGLGENASDLRYHAIAVYGHSAAGFSAYAGRALPAGYWCADGDNWAQGNRLQFYADATLAAALPCAAVAVYPTWAAPAPVADPGGTNAVGSPTSIPAGYTDASATDGAGAIRCARTGVVLTHAMAYWLKLNPQAGDALFAERDLDGKYGYIAFRDATGNGLVAVYVRASDVVVTNYAGPLLAAVAAEADVANAAAKAQEAQLASQLLAAQATIRQLQAEVDAAKAAAAAAAPANPKATALVAAMRDALGLP